MKREEVEQQIPDITKEQLDWLMSENGKDVTREKSKLDAYKQKTDAELEELRAAKEDLDSLKQANMTAEQAAEAALKQAEKAKAEYALKSNRLDTIQRFVAAEIPEDDYTKLLDSIVSDDDKATAAAADAIISVITAQRDAAGQSVRKELIGSTPSPAIGGNGEKGMTKEQFQKLSLMEKQEIASTNPDLYNSFYQD